MKFTAFWFDWLGVVVGVLMFCTAPLLLFIIIPSVGFVHGWHSVLNFMSFESVLGVRARLTSFMIALTLNALFHEAGHFLCARLHGAPVDTKAGFIGIGWTRVFVKVKVNGLSLHQKLAIATAGVWHNMALAILLLVLSAVMQSMISTSDLPETLLNWPQCPVMTVPVDSWHYTIHQSFLYSSVLSISYGLFNILPFSGLDGMRVVETLQLQH